MQKALRFVAVLSLMAALPALCGDAQKAPENKPCPVNGLARDPIGVFSNGGPTMWQKAGFVLTSQLAGIPFPVTVGALVVTEIANHYINPNTIHQDDLTFLASTNSDLSKQMLARVKEGKLKVIPSQLFKSNK
jgi:hypothetical protein